MSCQGHRRDSENIGRGVPFEIISLFLVACAPAVPSSSPEVVIPALDYSFQIPPELPAGPTQFRIDNQGKVSHEMALGQLKAGVSADSVMAYINGGGDPGDLTDGVVGILIAKAGTRSLGTLRADLVPGRTYMMICQFKDGDSLPPHMAMGMVASFVAK